MFSRGTNDTCPALFIWTLLKVSVRVADKCVDVLENPAVRSNLWVLNLLLAEFHLALLLLMPIERITYIQLMQSQTPERDDEILEYIDAWQYNDSEIRGWITYVRLLKADLHRQGYHANALAITRVPVSPV